MNKFKVLSRICLAAAILLSDAMCAVVGYQYRVMEWGMRHDGWSAPPSVAFVYGIPFAVGIALFLVLSWLLHKKASDQ